MADELPEKDAQAVIERTCRIVLDVKISISKITPENVADYFTPSEIGEKLPWEWAERQNRLLQMLIEDHEALHLYLISIAADDLGVLLDSRYIRGLQDEEEDKILEKVYSAMDSRDAHFFQEAKKDGVLYENTELVGRAFKTDWKGAELKDITVVE